MDVTISSGFSGRPYDLRMRVYTIENNVGGNYSRYRGDRYAYSRSGYGSFMSDGRTVNSWIAGHHAGGSYSLPFAPGDFAGKTIGLGSYDTGGVGHDGNGNVWFTSRIQMLNASVFGSADTGDVGMWGDHIIRPPGAPSNLGVVNVSTTCFGVNYNRNGESITGDHAQWATDPGFANVVWDDFGPGGYTSPCGGAGPVLAPGTKHYVRIRSTNAAGSGPWSSTVEQTTLPAVAPGLAVAPSISGTGALVTFAPPGGATGVTEYNLEYRLGGTTWATTSTTTSKAIGGLTPGAQYEWRANAEFGSYVSPWTAWTPVVQPNPNTNPGDYFDGSTPPRGDVTFSWNGAANNSTSDAEGVGVEGWSVDAIAGGGEVRLQRVTGGATGAFSARMLVITTAAGAGKTLGMTTIAGESAKRAAVEEGQNYVGSIFVRPSRAQRLAAEIVFMTAAGVQVGAAVQGDAVVVTDTVNWTRLSVPGVVPATAEYAAARAIDVAGVGHSPWLSGDFLDGDAAMVSLATLFPYFDGNSPADPVQGFEFEWEGPENASPSVRNVVPMAVGDPLRDPDCPPQPTPPSLPTIPSDCIDEVGTWRRYMSQVPATEVRAWSSTLPTLILETDGSAERQVRVRYWPNPNGLAPSELTGNGAWESEQILSYIPPEAVITLDGVTQLVTATVDGGTALPADHLLYGTGGTPATWPELRCGIGYVVTMDVPLEAPAGNLKSRVIVTQRM